MGLGEGPRRASSATWMGMPMKHISLVALTIQNSTLILILYHSRVMPLVGGQRYFASTAIFLHEVLKLGICLTIALYEISQRLSPALPATSLFSTLTNAVFTGDSWKLAIPASLYTLHNTLQYVAIANLEAATLQVTYQFKILPTALFSILLLRRTLSGRQWVALALLMFGVAILQIPTTTSSHLNLLKETHARIHLPRSIDDLRNLGSVVASPVYKRSATYEGIEEDLLLEHPTMSSPLGFFAAIIACIASALASVWYEKILKESSTDVSLWVRNVQLSMYSLFPSLFIGVMFVDGEAIAKSSFFVGYNWVVWTTIVLQALGGILVALCITFADNIAKSFAISISILIGLCASVWFFSFTLTTNFLIGTLMVVFATYLYNSKARPRPPPIQIHEYEKTTIDSESSRRKEFNLNLKGPRTPLKAEGLSSSRPGSPMLHHTRVGSSRGYFSEKHRDE